MCCCAAIEVAFVNVLHIVDATLLDIEQLHFCCTAVFQSFAQAE